MTTLRASVTVSRDIADAFAYTSDFANVSRWDPGVAESRRLGDGPVGPGADFEIMVAFGRSRIPMTYTITEFSPPHRVVLEGKGEKLAAVDTISFASVPGGTKIDYVAELTFSNFVRFLEPFLGRTFKKVGEKAVSGLAAALDEST